MTHPLTPWLHGPRLHVRFSGWVNHLPGRARCRPGSLSKRRTCNSVRNSSKHRVLAWRSPYESVNTGDTRIHTEFSQCISVNLRVQKCKQLEIIVHPQNRENHCKCWALLACAGLNSLYVSHYAQPIRRSVALYGVVLDVTTGRPVPKKGTIDLCAVSAGANAETQAWT